MMRYLLVAAILPALFAALLPAADSFAEDISGDGLTTIRETVLSMKIDGSNTLPWAFVEGRIANHVPGHPVIIQIFEAGGGDTFDDSAVRVAQTLVNPDGSYEYRFRVFDMSGGERINILEGDYTVKIFKTVYLDSGSDLV